MPPEREELTAKGGIGVESAVARALRYRNLAEENRARALAATSEETRATLLALAEDYDTMAKLIEDAEKNRSG